MKYQVIRLRSVLLSAALIGALFLFCLLGNRMIRVVSTRAEPENTADETGPLIIIDAGHGGEDGGVQTADGIPEKDVNLSVAEKLEATLKARGFETLMTRTDDTLTYDESKTTMREKKVSDIHNRASLIEAHPGCVVLSIHQNYFEDTRCTGTQVFFSPNHAGSEALANAIQSAVVAALQPGNTRAVKQSGKEIYLLYHAAVPAVMVECGFLSNPEEAARLLDETYQSDLAAAIADGLEAYLNTRS